MGGAEALLEAVSFKKAMESIGTGRVANARQDAENVHLVSEGPRRQLRSTDRVLFYAHTKHLVTGVLPGHVYATAHVTRTSPTRVSGVNLKRASFLAAGAQCNILLNCATQIALLN